MSLFTGLNRRSAFADTWERDLPFYSVDTESGQKVTEDIALKYSVFWASVSLISESIAMQRFMSVKEVVEQKGDSMVIMRRPLILPTWVNAPMADMSRFDVYQQLIASTLITGNGYGQRIRRATDQVQVGLMPIHPSRVECQWDPYRKGARRYRVDGGEWQDSSQIAHLMGFSKAGSPVGMSVLEYAREGIGLGLTTEKFGARLFKNGSMLGGVIQRPDKGDKESNDFMIRSFEAHHKGVGNWHRPAMLTGGATYQPISIPPEDAQFLQTREFQALDVARWFRVPPHRVNIVSKTTSWGSGLEEENKMFLQITLGPWRREGRN